MTLYYYLCKWTESEKEAQHLGREPQTHHYGILCGGENGKAEFHIYEAGLLKVGLRGRQLHDGRQVLVLSERPLRSLLQDAAITEPAIHGRRSVLLKHYERVKPITQEELREHCKGLEHMVHTSTP